MFSLFSTDQKDVFSPLSIPVQVRALIIRGTASRSAANGSVLEVVGGCGYYCGSPRYNPVADLYG